MLELPDRNKIRDGVQESPAKASNGKYVTMPTIRPALELPILEDVGIKIKHKLNYRRKKNMIGDIIFTQTTKPEDLFSLMRKMCLGNNDEIAAFDRIHEWGSKGVHKGKAVPLSVI